MKDVTGREIEIGDTVATAQKRGSSNWLNVYPVVGMEDGKPVLEGLRHVKRDGGEIRQEKFRIFYSRGEDTIAILGKAEVSKHDRCFERDSSYDTGDEA